MKLIDLMSYVYEKQNVIITDMAIMEENNVNFYNSDYSYIGTGHYSGIAKNVPIYHATVVHIGWSSLYHRAGYGSVVGLL